MQLLQSKKNGFSLIEVLIALLVISLGLLGVMALQMSSLKHNQSSNHRTLAVYAAYDVIDRMRANNPNARSGAYDIEIGEERGADGSLASDDLIAWKTQLATWLPLGDGSIERNANVFTIRIQWDESRSRDGVSEQQFVFLTQL